MAAPWKADVGDVVLAAPVRAAADLDVHLFDRRVPVGRGVAQKLLSNGASEAHGGGDSQLAAIRAGAGHHIGYGVVVGVGEADGVEFLPQIKEPTLGHPAQGKVLLQSGAGGAAGELPDDVWQGQGTVQP